MAAPARPSLSPCKFCGAQISRAAGCVCESSMFFICLLPAGARSCQYFGYLGGGFDVFFTQQGPHVASELHVNFSISNPKRHIFE